MPNGLGASGKVKIHTAVGPTDDTTARLVVYSPVRFAVNGGTAGSVIGTVEARVRAGDLGGAIVPVPGEIEVRAPTGTALVSGVPVPLAQLAMQCTGTTTHTAYWVFKLTAAGNALELAAFFDLTTGAEQALGTSKITFCLPPDDVPAGTPGRSPLGIKLVDAVLTFNRRRLHEPVDGGPVPLDVDLDAVQPRRRDGQRRRHRLRGLGDAAADLADARRGRTRRRRSRPRWPAGSPSPGSSWPA